MSDAHSHSHVPGGGGPESIHDMALGKIVIVGVVSLALFAAGIIWAYQIMVGQENEVRAKGTASAPTEIGKQEIGIVDQTPFDLDQRLDIWRAKTAKRLSSYGWVDRAKGLAHIPIAEAMRQVVANPPDIAGEGVPHAAGTRPPAPSAPAAPAPSPRPGGKR